MRLYIVRHGETYENRHRICQGQTDGTLTEEGKEGARQVGRHLKDCYFDICYTSDQKRAAITADIILAEHSDKYDIILDERLRERFYGKMQGRVFPKEYDYDYFFWSEAESPEAIRVRLLSFLKEIETKYPEGSVLMVSHGFTLKIFLSILNQIDGDGWKEMPELSNTSLTIAEGLGTYTITSLNQTDYLSGGQL